MNVGALAIFAFVGSITPGPNNLMLWASGMNFGLRRTVRHLAGVNIGFSSLLVAVALGLGTLFQTLPWLSAVLRVFGSGYLLYLAYRIARAGRTEAGGTARPFTFTEAVAFQYVNPKAWVMAITAVGAFLPADQSVIVATAVLAGVFAIINLPCIATWAAAGTAVGRVMRDDHRRRAVNGALALLLVGTIYLINA